MEFGDLTTDERYDAVTFRVDLRWGQDAPEPYLVPVLRIPCVGERLVGPDDTGEFVIVGVTYIYESGFALPPTMVRVEAERLRMAV